MSMRMMVLCRVCVGLSNVPCAGKPYLEAVWAIWFSLLPKEPDRVCFVFCDVVWQSQLMNPCISVAMQSRWQSQVAAAESLAKAIRLYVFVPISSEMTSFDICGCVAGNSRSVWAKTQRTRRPSRLSSHRQ